jgi:hypothetical protein
LTGKRDYQRSRVYAWENRVVAPRDPSVVLLPEAQGMVNAIWWEMGLLYPPKIEPLPKQATKTVASATRLSIFLGARTQSWCLLHEIAHVMTAGVDGGSDGHSGRFMAVYAQLLVKYLRMDATELIKSLNDEGITIDVNSQPLLLAP